MVDLIHPDKRKRSIATSMVRPSIAEQSSRSVFSPDQELQPFARWAGKPIWVPPRNASTDLARTMHKKSSWRSSAEQGWSFVEKAHRSEFTQVREVELCKASIRLPKGKLLVTVTERDRFDQIKEKIPDCVRTRLDEFLAGPGQRPGVKVFYLRPLCVEVDESLVFTSREDVMTAVKSIQDEVFAEYRRLYLQSVPTRLASCTLNAVMALPRAVVNLYVNRQKKAIDAYQAKLEFKRRKTVLRATKTHRKCFTTGCTFDEMMALTNPFSRADVITQYGIERGLTAAQRRRLLLIVAGTLPWFAVFTIATASIVSMSAAAMAPVAVCDPVFVAEMPEAPGILLKIGHFDDIGGVTHVEI